jgi:hypothetical protein
VILVLYWHRGVTVLPYFPYWDGATSTARTKIELYLLIALPHSTSLWHPPYMHGHRAGLIERYEKELGSSAQANRKRLTVDRSIDSQAAG